MQCSAVQRGDYAFAYDAVGLEAMDLLIGGDPAVERLIELTSGGKAEPLAEQCDPWTVGAL